MPNAANHERVMAEFSTQADCIVSDLQASTVFLAVQGPEAPDLLKGVLGLEPGRFRCAETAWEGREVGVAGTGYTGEAGAELCLPLELGESLLAAILEAGATPAGLGARDTLRLEACMRLYGNEMDDSVTILEAGLGWIVAWEKGDFVGRGRLAEQQARGLERQLVAFEMIDRAIARHGAPVLQGGQPCGVVTSGTQTPYLNKAIGLAMVPSELAVVGQELAVDVRGRVTRARVVPEPFYKRPPRPRRGV
jgi:aminomethyltransferase